jgi:hypothetical protein
MTSAVQKQKMHLRIIEFYKGLFSNSIIWNYEFTGISGEKLLPDSDF